MNHLVELARAVGPVEVFFVSMGLVFGAALTITARIFHVARDPRIREVADALAQANCGACTKVCPSGAVMVADNLARIDPARCTSCGACITACPVHVIISLAG